MRTILLLLLCVAFSAAGAPSYEGYAEDRASLRDTYQLPKPPLRASSGKAIEAARRLFKNVSFVGLPRAEALSILGDPRTISDYGIAASPAPDSSLVYRFDSGFGGYQYTLHFNADRVTKVFEEGLD
jgi:hypothetical protein